MKRKQVHNPVLDESDEECVSEPTATVSYYECLGLARDCAEDEIRRAYRKKALLYHPDKLSSLSESDREEKIRMWHDIKEAYEVLVCPNKRMQYDTTGLRSNDTGIDFAALLKEMMMNAESGAPVVMFFN